MAIVKMNRFTLMTFDSHKSALLKAFQRFRQVHFKPLRLEEWDENLVQNTDNTTAYENGLLKVSLALEKLKPYVTPSKGLAALREIPQKMTYRELDEYTAKFDYETVCATVNESDERLKKLRNEYTKLKANNENLQPWLELDADPSKLNELQSVRSAIGTIKITVSGSFSSELSDYFPDIYIEQLLTVKHDAIFLILAYESEWTALTDILKKHNFTRTPIPSQVMPRLQIEANSDRINELEVTLEEVHKELKSHSNQYKKLLITADYFKTTLARAKVCKNFMNLGQTLIIEGWVPADEMDKLRQIIESVCGDEFYIEDTPVERESIDVPIKLKNNRIISAFESITSMYSLPRYNEIDPTPLFTPFYWLFFGLMVGDVGYGLIVLICTFLAMKFFHLKTKMLNFIKFFHYISYAIILAGCLYGSVFGFTPSFLNLTTAIDGTPKPLLSAELDIVTKMILSISVGIVHLLFGIAVKGYLLIRNGKYLDAVLDSLLWIIAVTGGIGWITSMTGLLPGWAVEVSKWCFIVSMVLLVLTQGRGNKSLGGKIGGGLFGAYGITGYLGDLVSYTRIVALALSSAYIAMSFNIMAELMPNLPLRIFVGGIILILGQTLNLGLALLGAYVHSCRLQYVEYFGKFYEGGGVPFKPLAPQNTAVKLTDID